MDCSPNNPWATGARHQQMAKCVISWEGTQQAHLYINRRRGSQQDVLGDEAWANEAAHALSWDLSPERCSWRFQALVIASECMMTTEMNMCEPNNNKPLERAKRWRLHCCFKPTANVTIPEMLKVVVPLTLHKASRLQRIVFWDCRTSTTFILRSLKHLIGFKATAE